MYVYFGSFVTTDPENTQCPNNVITMSLQRRDVAATLLRRCVFAGNWPRKASVRRLVYMFTVWSNVYVTLLFCNRST